MVSAIVLAGGPVKDAPNLKLARWYYKKVYGETYFWGKYKPLKQIKLRVGDEIQKVPMVSAVIESIAKVESIDDLVVIGEKERLETMLGDKDYGMPVKYVQQVGSLVKNGVEGYQHSKAKKNGEGALFLPCDIPKASPEDYDKFVNQCTPLMDNYDTFYAIIGKENMQGKSKIFNRPYFWMIDDVFNKRGLIRRGFRLSNMAYANPEEIKHINNIDLIYSLRKMKDPVNVFRAAKDAFPEVIKYFKKTLTVSDVNNKASEFLETRFKLIEVDSEATCIDIDSEEDSNDLDYWLGKKEGETENIDSSCKKRIFKSKLSKDISYNKKIFDRKNPV